MIGRYRPQIRADLLHEFGVDLRDWLRPCHVVALLDLIEQCPAASRWREAASQDEDYMRQARARKVDAPREKWAPRMSEFDLNAMLLANLTNLVGVIAEGKKIKKFDPVPMPRTVEDKLDAEMAMQSAMSLISQLTPHALTGR